MVDVGMRDEDVAHPQKLAGGQTRDVADVKQDRPPLELQVDEYPRVAERPVDQRRVENGPHLAENTIRGPSEFARRRPDTQGGRSHDKGWNYFLDIFPRQFMDASRTKK